MIGWDLLTLTIPKDKKHPQIKKEVYMIKQFLAPYKNAIVGIVIFGVLFSVGFAGVKYGGNRVQSKWDKQTIEIKTREVQLQTRIIDLQNEARERDKAQAIKDAELAKRGAEERARLEEQAKAVKNSLDKLTRDVAKAPQYRECKVDTQTLEELNRSLK